MSKSIQIRKVPNALHRVLRARASKAGMSLSGYLRVELQEIAERPTLAEFRQQLHRREPVLTGIDSARLVREQRDSR